jgi:uncharacterized membrane protein YdbT with pleckstrin-like domain
MGTDDANKKFKPQFPGQHEDEEVRLVFRQHIAVARKPFLYGTLILLLALIPLTFSAVYTVAWLPGILFKMFVAVGVIVLAVWFFAWASWYYSVYILSNRRLVSIKQKGLFDRSVLEWQLDKIYNVNYRVGGLQATLLGYGDITIKTAIGEFIMPKIHHPVDVHRKILLAVREADPQDVGSLIDNSVSMM